MKLARANCIQTAAQLRAQAGRQRQAIRPGLAVRGTFSPARAWCPAIVAHLVRTTSLKPRSAQYFRVFLHWTVCAVWLSTYLPSSAASFPCQKARTDVEQAVCRDQNLSALDEHLGRYYAVAHTQFRHATECLVSDQKAWLRDVRDTCKDIACLKAAYLLRLSALDGVQPGTTALRNVQLPRTPTLVGILPPAKDRAAAPGAPNLKPLSVQGMLVSEVSSGDGYVMVSSAGRRHLLAPLMLLDDSTAVLESLSGEAATTYLVRGHAESGATGHEAFSQSRCRYIYRVPQ